MTAHPWTARTVPVFAGQHDTHVATGEDYSVCTLASLFAIEPARQPKASGPALIPSTYNGYDARCHAVQRERGAYIALTGDVDQGDHPLPAIKGLVRSFAGDAAFLIYTSPHARPGDRRWRVILPLDGVLPFAQWNDAQHAFYAFMEAHGVKMDHALARAGQPVYLPNVPDRHGKTGDPLRGADGAPLHYEHATTGTGVPGLCLDTDPIAGGIARIVAKREADDRERRRLRTEAERRLAAMPQTGGESLIAEFNRANALPDLLTSYGYQQSPRNADDWRSPLQTGESYATRIMGRKWVSLSGSDAAAGVGARSASGCYGDGFDLFAHYEHGGNSTTAICQLGRARDAVRLRQEQAAMVMRSGANIVRGAASSERGQAA